MESSGTIDITVAMMMRTRTAECMGVIGWLAAAAAAPWSLLLVLDPDAGVRCFGDLGLILLLL